MEDDYGRRVPTERVRQVDRFDSAKYALPPEPPKPEGERKPDAKRTSRLEGAESLSLTLEEVRAATLANNLDLKVLLIDPTIAGESLREEESKFEAVFRPSFRFSENDDPTLDTTASNQQNFTLIGGGVDIPLRTGGRVSVDLTESHSETGNPFITLNSAYQSALTFSVSQPLLRGAGRRASTYTIRIAAYNEQISQARTKLEVIRELAAADRAYWLLDAARRALDISQQQYELAIAQLEKARRRVNAGDAAEVEVVRAEAGVAERLGAIIGAENAVLQQQRAIKRIINRPDLDIDTRTLIIPATAPDPARYRFDPAELTEQAVANRMEMLELELRLAADYSTIEFNKNQALPLLVLDYQYSIGGLGTSVAASNNLLVDNRFESWSVGLSGQVPLGNEGAKARVQQSILARLQRLSTRDARRQSIREEVLDSIDSVEAAWQQIMAARQATIAAARTLQAEQREFDQGTRTSTDVLDAATKLADSQRAEVRAVVDYQVSLVDLAFATGTLLGASRIDWSPSDPRGPGDDPTGPAFPFPGPGLPKGEGVGPDSSANPPAQ